MKFRSIALSASIACAVPALAQESPRFAVFVPGYLIENTAQGKRVFAEAQTLAKRLEDTIKAKGEELQKMEQQLRSSSISAEGRSKIAREFEDGKVAFQRMQEDSRVQFQKVEQTAVQQFQSEIAPIVEALAKEQNLHCVLQATEMIAWADQTWFMKFTKEVALRYDAAFPGGAAPKPPAKAPGK
jgi:Skp family chaperone for outer membrane proteins